MRTQGNKAVENRGRLHRWDGGREATREATVQVHSPRSVARLPARATGSTRGGKKTKTDTQKREAKRGNKSVPAGIHKAGRALPLEPPKTRLHGRDHRGPEPNKKRRESLRS